MILEEIAAYAVQRVQKAKERLPYPAVREEALKKGRDTGFPAEQILGEEGMHFICEVKKASPSKGVIAEDFPYLEIAGDYEAGGASAISCLTEPFWFQGQDRYLEEIAAQVSIPVLRKDFTCDEYMIYQARAMGAAAVLLICSVLDEKDGGQLKSLT